MAIATLISLSGDSDRDVRNWATFGLGSMTEVDSGQLRDALLARVAEADEEIAGDTKGLAQSRVGPGPPGEVFSSITGTEVQALHSRIIAFDNLPGARDR